MTKQDAIFIASLFAVIALLFFICIKLDESSCRSKAQKMGFECDWGIEYGCMINVNGKWMPIKAYRVIE